MNFCERIPYVNARLRARKSRFLGRERLERLALAKSVEEVTGAIADTPHAPHLVRAAALEPEPVRAAEEGLARSVAADLAQVRGFAPELADTPGRYLFAMWDLRNLKTVLRGVHGRTPPDRILASCWSAGWVREAVWQEVARSPSVEEAVGKVISMDLGFRRALREGWPEYGRTRRVTSLELPLDRYFFRSALAAVEDTGAPWQPLESLVRFDIDVRNLAAVLEWLGHRERPGTDDLIPGGRWTARVFCETLEAEAEPVSFAARSLRRWLHAEGAEAASQLESGRFDDALEALERASWVIRARRLSGHPLSLDILIGYLWAGTAEAADLRRIVWGIHMGVPPERIQGGFLTPGR